MKEDVTLEVLTPRAELEGAKPIALCPGVADLGGKRVGLVDNTKQGASQLLVSIAELLRGRFPDVKIRTWMKKGVTDIEVELYEKVAEESDAVIFAIGD